MSTRLLASLLLVASIACGACSTVLGFEDVELDELTASSSSSSGGGASDGGGGAGGEAGAAGGGGGGGAAPLGPSCAAYCDAVMESCTGLHQVYVTIETCLAVCAVLPPGDSAAPARNTIACRLDNALKAAATGEPALHCPIAGPGGEGACGESCDGFCTLMVELCPGAFDSSDACHAACEALDDPDGYSVSLQNQAGPTVECRLFHASAASIDAEMHCPHAAGAAPCNDGGGY